ncbi:hypothetical protein NMY22_g15257 [Coprinellus aureogranulatus]|nr:hypothetical protein NMY22_g15257 [Coprinellus aureogranulatus]
MNHILAPPAQLYQKSLKHHTPPTSRQNLERPRLDSTFIVFSYTMVTTASTSWHLAPPTTDLRCGPWHRHQQEAKEMRVGFGLPVSPQGLTRDKREVPIEFLLAYKVNLRNHGLTIHHFPEAPSSRRIPFRCSSTIQIVFPQASTFRPRSVRLSLASNSDSEEQSRSDKIDDGFEEVGTIPYVGYSDFDSRRADFVSESEVAGYTTVAVL